MKSRGIGLKLKRALGLLRTGNVGWLTHRLRLFFLPFSEHPSALSFIESQNIAPVSPRKKNLKRLLFVSHDLKREGAAISLFELVQALREKLSVTVQVLAFGDGPLAESYARLGVPLKVISQRIDELASLRRLQAFKARLKDEIRALSPDLVFANTLHAFPAILAAHDEEIPSVWNIREGVSGEAGFRGLPYKVARIAVSCALKANRVLFVSRASRAKWSRYESLGRFEVIVNALNPERIGEAPPFGQRAALRRQYGLDPASFVFLSAGSLEPRKGQLDLIRAFLNLSESYKSQCEIILLGDQNHPYAEKLKALCQKNFGGQRVHFMASREQVQPFYAIADAFVLSSRSESYPRVILEAMAAGLPVITTPVDGVPEQVLENENAFYYNPGDLTALSERLRQLLTDPSLTAAMGKRSRERFEAFPSFDEMCGRYAAVVQDLFK